MRYAEQRENYELNDSRLIGNRSARSAYSFIDDDFKKILRALQIEPDQVKARFCDAETVSGGDFNL